jgi:hypothetical protein
MPPVSDQFRQDVAGLDVVFHQQDVHTDYS